MEIFSYVGFENNNVRSRVKKLFVPLKRKQKSSVDVFSFSKYTFSSSSVKNNFSLKYLPLFMSRLCDFTISKLMSLGIALAVLLTIMCIKLGLDYKASHTGPLKLEMGEKKELELLNSIMSNFALDTIEYNELGELKGAMPLPTTFKKAVTFQNYIVKNGDTISGITKKFGLLNLSTIIALNNIKDARALHLGQKLRIPSIDGMIHTVKEGNTLQGLSSKYGVPLEDLLDVNDLSTQTLFVGQEIFIPGARLDSSTLGEVLGTLFKKPIRNFYKLSSRFGWRADPFTGVRSYHSGIDMACARGTSIYAALPGTVLYVGWSNVFGNYVVVSHANNYQTLYGHMDKVVAKKRQQVNQSTLLGTVGSTGYSTGDHLHFTVYKNGKPVDPLLLLK
ncbi:MAG: M23 family metallopeptidase [Treponema sp.]|nr:M23 family metallopeptidase [Treponema sp.]